ncbi:MAG: toprim domain-containing protein, partial [Gammaproteobacteria bacterium]
RHEAAAERVSHQMAQLVPVVTPTPYLLAKGIAAHVGVMTDEAGQKTYIPAFDPEEKPWTLQAIETDGSKRFAKDSRKAGCFHPLGGFAALAAAPVLVIAEGYATAATLAEALGQATVAAFDSSNLPAVAWALHEKYPEKPIIIAGDDDRHLKATQGITPGRLKAKEAAEAVDGRALFPIFAPGEQRADPKAFTDFNDLATKSTLGQAGVERQVKAAVKKVLLDQGERQQTKHLAQAKRRRPARIG